MLYNPLNHVIMQFKKKSFNRVDIDTVKVNTITNFRILTYIMG